MVLLRRFYIMRFIGLLILPIFSNAQPCLTKLKLDGFIEDYIQKTNSDSPNDVLVMVVSCSKSDTLELSLSHTSSAQTFEYINADHYYLYGKDYLLVRLYKYENNCFLASLPFHKLDEYSAKQINNLLLAPDVMVNSDYPTVVYRCAKNYSDSVWYNSSNDIPRNKLYLDQFDNDYITNLNYIQIDKSTELTNQIPINTRIIEFSFYYSKNNKSIFCFEGTNGESYKFPRQYDNNADFSDVGFDFQINDSIIKKHNNDTILIFRGSERYQFTLPY